MKRVLRVCGSHAQLWASGPVAARPGGFQLIGRVCFCGTHTWIMKNSPGFYSSGPGCLGPWFQGRSEDQCEEFLVSGLWSLLQSFSTLL